MNGVRRRWLIDLCDARWPDEEVLPVDFLTITQVYLSVHEPVVSQVRCSNIHLDEYVALQEYIHTVKIRSVGVENDREIERLIDADEYIRLITQHRDKDRAAITKKRRVFTWGTRQWELDRFPKEFSILTCELPRLDEEIHTPPWLHVIREITAESGWSSYEMTHKDWERPDGL